MLSELAQRSSQNREVCLTSTAIYTRGPRPSIPAKGLQQSLAATGWRCRWLGLMHLGTLHAGSDADCEHWHAAVKWVLDTAALAWVRKLIFIPVSPIHFQPISAASEIMLLYTAT